MKLIVGLGNPGKEYERTRHNSGFMAIDRLADKCGASITTSKWNALVATTRIEGQAVLLMKPLTYMNLSGQAVVQAVNYYKIDPSDIIVIHDDMDIPVGSLRIRKNGSAGGQKGMKNIMDILGTKEIARIRVGVGHDQKGKTVPDFVLSPVAKADQDKFDIALNGASDAAYAWVFETMDIVMNKYNIKEKKPKKPKNAWKLEQKAKQAEEEKKSEEVEA